MRFIGSLETEKQAYVFHAFLLTQGVQCAYEPYVDEETKERRFRIWVHDEDELQMAMEWLDLYKKDPNDPRFIVIEQPVITAPHPDLKQLEKENKTVKRGRWRVKIDIKPKRSALSFPITMGIITLCAFLFFWNSGQQFELVKSRGEASLEMDVTPLERLMLFDYPASIEETDQLLSNYPLKSPDEIKTLPPAVQAQFAKAQELPTWPGFFGLLAHWPKGGWGEIKSLPFFTKIREGEVWRLFTPVLMHQGLLHILFNMAWIWLLCPQLEERLSKWKILLLVLLIGVLSNVAQYLMSGPMFLGFSGIVIGLVGFIWMRQRVAPWEGYPLQRPIILFTLVFVLAIAALDIFSFALELFGITNLFSRFGNTAHIAGGLLGMFFGRFHFFGRRKT